MLCQLVCVDRRYQRMNCFNIRELQGILKRRFFTDMVNTSDHRQILESSMIGLRFKTNNELSLDSDTLSFHNYGTTNSNKQRSVMLSNLYLYQSDNGTVGGNSNLTYFSLESLVQVVSSYLALAYSMIQSANLKSILSLNPSYTLKNLAFSTQQPLNVSYAYYNPGMIMSTNGGGTDASKTPYVSSNQNSSGLLSSTAYNYIEDSSEYRYNRFSNSIISYDYKCGHYLGI